MGAFFGAFSGKGKRMAESITSRKNSHIRHLRSLESDRAYRRQTGEFLCDGEKLLEEALSNGASIGEILCREGREIACPGVPVYTAPDELFSYASPLQNSPGPLFTVKCRPYAAEERPHGVLVLENVQDPGNVGTVFRTAAALGVELVVLCGECADPYNTKTVRAAMGALFRQKFVNMTLPELSDTLKKWDMPLFGAALRAESEDVRTVTLKNCAVAVGNEGRGLSEDILRLCDKKIILPMTPGSESFNAAVAASLLMWEMKKTAL